MQEPPKTERTSRKSSAIDNYKDKEQHQSIQKSKHDVNKNLDKRPSGNVELTKRGSGGAILSVTFEQKGKGLKDLLG